MTGIRAIVSSRSRRAALALALSSLGALSMLPGAAIATHVAPIGASPVRIPLVPTLTQCNSGAVNSMHVPPISIPSCHPPIPTSNTVTVGPNALGFLRVVVCPIGTPATFCNPTPSGVMPLPDIRITGSIRDVTCRQTGTPVGCTAGQDYNPNMGPGFYTNGGNGTTGATPACFPTGSSPSDCAAGTDVTATFELDNPATTTASGGHGLRVTDDYNCNPSGSPPCPPGPPYPATAADIQYPIPLDCLPTTSTTQGSTCGVNTTMNALVPGFIINGKKVVFEAGQVRLLDSGGDGVRGSGDDQAFAAEGLFLP